MYNALGKIGDPQAASTLLKALKNEEHPNLRANAASALRNSPDQSVLPELLEDLDNEASVIVQARIIDSLGNYPRPEAVEKLIFIMKENNARLQVRAIRSLGLTGVSDAVEPLHKALHQTNNDYPPS